MKRFPCSIPKLLLLTGLLSGAALAEKAESRGLAEIRLLAETVCAAPEDLLEVVVNGSSRGTLVVRRTPDLVAVPASALVASEQKDRTRITCAGEGFYLFPADQSRDLPEQQRLELTLSVDDLDTQVISVQGQQMNTVRLLDTLPTWSVDFDLRGQKTQHHLGGLASVGVNLLAGDLTARVGSTLSAQGEQLQVLPTAEVQQKLDDHWTVIGHWNDPLDLLPLQTRPADSSKTFSGVQLNLLSSQPVYHAPIDLLIRQPSQVSLLVNGRLLATYAVQPGPLRLQDIPLPAGRGKLSVVVSNSMGKTRHEFPFQVLGNQLLAGTQQFSVHAGWAGDAFQVGLTGIQGLAQGWMLEGQATWSPSGPLHASVYTHWKDEHQKVSAGLTGQLLENQFSSNLTLNYQLALPQWSFSAGAHMPLLNPEGLQLKSSFTIQDDSFNFGLEGSHDLSSQLLEGKVRTEWIFQETSRVYAYVGVNNQQGYRVGVGARIQLDPQTQVTAELDHSARPGSTSTQPSLQASTQLDSENSLSVRVRPQLSEVKYEHHSQLDFSASLDTRLNFTAALRGSVSVVEDHLQFSSKRGGSGLLIKTGVPGLAISVNGNPAGKTDASGNLLVLGLQTGTVHGLGINLDQLPFNISASVDSESVLLKNAGIAVLDWTSRFEVSRWVQFRIKDAPATYGTVEIDGLPHLLDDQGWALLGPATQGKTGILVTEQGERCPVTIDAGTETVHCS